MKIKYNSRKLQKSEEGADFFFKKFMDESSGSFFVTDPSARILYVTKSIENHTGFSVAETIGKKPGQLWGGRMPRSFYQHLWHTLAEKRQPFIAEVTNQTKNGRVYSHQLFLAPLISRETDRPVYFLAFKPAIPQIVFSSRFLDFFSRPSLQPKMFMQQVISAVHTQLLPPLIGRAVMEHASLPDFLRQFLIEPAQKSFSYRDDDRKLVEEAQMDRQLFQRIYEKYYADVNRYFLHRLGFDTHQADDFSQETFTRALLYLPHFQPSNASYLTYLLRIAHNMLVNFYRRKKDTPYEHLELIPDVDADAEALLERKNIWHVLRHLSDIERRIMIMKYREGYAAREIAVSLNKTENAIKLHLSRARKKLRHIMTVTDKKGA